MIIVNFNNLYHDIIVLIKRNKAKFMLLIALVAFGVILGIMRGVAILKTAEVVKIETLNITLLIKRSRGMLGYFLISMLGCALFLFIVLICSYRFQVTFISAVLLAIITFFSVKNLILLFGVIKLSFVLAGIIYILFLLLKTAIFILLILHTMDRCFDKFCRFSHIVSDILHTYALILIPIFILCLAESILITILTAAIVL